MDWDFEKEKNDMRLSEQTGIGFIGMVLCAGGILCFLMAIIKDGVWAIAGSILIFAWVYLNVNISREHQGKTEDDNIIGKT